MCVHIQAGLPGQPNTNNDQTCLSTRKKKRKHETSSDNSEPEALLPPFQKKSRHPQCAVPEPINAECTPLQFPQIVIEVGPVSFRIHLKS